MTRRQWLRSGTPCASFFIVRNKEFLIFNDKKGSIAFKSVGFYGEIEMMSELTTQIDYLLAE